MEHDGGKAATSAAARPGTKAAILLLTTAFFELCEDARPNSKRQILEMGLPLR
jgi:hypothetical protein